jgi:hypothetical protein
MNTEKLATEEHGLAGKKVATEGTRKNTEKLGAEKHGLTRLAGSKDPALQLRKDPALQLRPGVGPGLETRPDAFRYNIRVYPCLSVAVSSVFIRGSMPAAVRGARPRSTRRR